MMRVIKEKNYIAISTKCQRSKTGIEDGRLILVREADKLLFRKQMEVGRWEE
jgi:hypothetical protein